MLSKRELTDMLTDIESDRIERTVSTNNIDKFSQAICAFANDFPNHKLPGYLIVGVHDKDGSIAGIDVSDQLLQNLAGIRNNGQVLPQPSLTVNKYSLEGGDIAVVEVFPHHLPPISYRGRVWIRNGPSKAIANEGEINMLTEKRTGLAKTFDARPSSGSSLEDLDTIFLQNTYLPLAVDDVALAEDQRPLTDQLSSLRIFDKVYDKPTNGGILIAGNNVNALMPGAYVQYVKFGGKTKAAAVQQEREFKGSVPEVLRALDPFIDFFNPARPIKVSALREKSVDKYPTNAIRELLNNAIMHRSYESNAPVQFYEYSDRIEISNPGGLYGLASAQNFPDQNDYRNPILAEAMKNLGYVNKFNRGIARSQSELAENGNPPAKFQYGPGQFSVTIGCSKHFIFEEETPEYIDSQYVTESVSGTNRASEPTRDLTTEKTEEETSQKPENQLNTIVHLNSKLPTPITHTAKSQSAEEETPEHTDNQTIKRKDLNKTDDISVGTNRQSSSRSKEEASQSIDNQKDTKLHLDTELDLPVKILIEMKKNRRIRIIDLSERLNVSETNIESHIKTLRENGMMRRIGSTKSGEWKVTHKGSLYIGRSKRD